MTAHDTDNRTDRAMTIAKLKTRLPDGCGLEGELIDAHYKQLTDGTPAERVVAIVVLAPVEQQQKVQQEKARVRSVTYQVAHIEPFTGSGEARLRDMLTEAIGDRTGALPLLFDPGPSEEDKAERAALLEDLLDWAEHNHIDLIQRWWDRHDKAFVPVPEKASLVTIRDFMVDVGVPFKAATRPDPDAPTMAGADPGPGPAGDPFDVPEPALEDEAAPPTPIRAPRTPRTRKGH